MMTPRIFYLRFFRFRHSYYVVWPGAPTLSSKNWKALGANLQGR